jgi:dihydroorotate dehydrogenase (NAD+) catalytic subunit
MTSPVTLAGLSLATPVLTASGCGGSGRELTPYLDVAALGAFTTRTVTLDPQPGSPGRRVVPTPSGVLSNTGLQNVGLQGFLATELPWLAQQRVRTVVSISAATLGEYGELARRVGNAPGVHGVEVNLAGPHHDGAPGPFDSDPHQAGKVLHVVRRDVPRGVTVLAKLSPAYAPLDMARSVVRNGADAVVVGHGLPGLAFDPVTLQPALGGGAGVLSGPAVLAQALRCVWELHAAMPDVPVVGAGGVRTGFDALSMLLAGATAVQVGTAMLLDPAAPVRIAEELAEEIGRRGLPGPGELVGLAHRSPSGEDTA